MPFTAQELDNISTAALDYHLRGPVHKQSIQEKPLLREMQRVQKTFPSGKENITIRVKGDYTTTIQGYSGDDTVTYANPANMKTVTYPWKEFHAGISLTLTELKKDGISVVNSLDGANTSMHDGREKTALANLLDDKLEDMSEGYSRGKNLMYLRDGTQDADLAPGLRSFVLDDPTSATVVAGLDQSANDWWRNRANLSISVTTPADQAIILQFTDEIRQLRRYGGKPNYAIAGSAFLDAVEAELRANGTYTQVGFMKNGPMDIGMADIALKGVTFMYDPTLDDESLQKYCFLLDTRHVRPYVMTGEDDKTHAPARPEDKYVIYRAMTWTGGMVCDQRNALGVYTIA